MVPEKIKMANGGENLKEVIGRTETDEIPVFRNGAFSVAGGGEEEKELVNRKLLDRFVPKGDILRHTMRELIASIRVVGENNFTCNQVLKAV